MQLLYAEYNNFSVRRLQYLVQVIKLGLLSKYITPFSPLHIHKQTHSRIHHSPNPLTHTHIYPSQITNHLYPRPTPTVPRATPTPPLKSTSLSWWSAYPVIFDRQQHCISSSKSYFLVSVLKGVRRLMWCCYRLISSVLLSLFITSPDTPLSRTRTHKPMYTLSSQSLLLLSSITTYSSLTPSPAPSPPAHANVRMPQVKCTT